jgi:hypothetical protein
MAVLLLISSWQPSAIVFFVLNFVLSFLYLCYLIWEIATGRVGLIDWKPTARRRQRLARREAMAKQRRLEIEQQRLEAALSRGPYRPQADFRAADDERARARHELLEAVERYGGLSPQARVAADKVKRYRG